MNVFFCFLYNIFFKRARTFAGILSGNSIRPYVLIYTIMSIIAADTLEKYNTKQIRNAYTRQVYIKPRYVLLVMSMVQFDY